MSSNGRNDRKSNDRPLGRKAGSGKGRQTSRTSSDRATGPAERQGRPANAAPRGTGAAQSRKPVRKRGFFDKCRAVVARFTDSVRRKARRFYARMMNGSLDMGYLKLGAIVLAAVLVLSCTACGIFWMFTNKNGYAVYLDGERVGVIKVVKNREITGNSLQMLAVKKLMQQLDGVNVKVNETVTVERIHASAKEFVPEDSVISEISSSFTYLVGAAQISVDDVDIALVKSTKEAQAILQKIQDAYHEDGFAFEIVTFAEDVRVNDEDIFVDPSEIIPSERACELLTANVEEQVIYTIKSGDALDSIASRHGMTRADVLKLNPGYTESTVLRIGDKLVLSVARPLLSVVTKERVEYEGVIEMPVEIRQNPAEYKTYAKILQQGRDGREKISAFVIRINGVKQAENEIVDREVLEPPITEIKEVGTSDTPPQQALGVFIMPTSGILTEYFNARRATHDGIDIANAYGTPIYAADGGIVIKARDSGDGYGRNVIIDHGNGFTTFYAHNSKILVTVGQKVAQGEQIATMGSTGNSSGSHCHFEIRINDVPVDPFLYLQ